MEPGLQKAADYYAIKMPVFSFEKTQRSRYQPWTRDEVYW